MDLSVLIPARNEMWLARTVADVLAHAHAQTEVIVVCDGDWPDPPVVDHPRLRLVRLPAPIGQRAATNLAARMARGRYVMKLDAHCSVADGFDQVLIDTARELGPDVTQIPQMRNLHAFWRYCLTCGLQAYQGPLTAFCDACKAERQWRREVVWEPRKGTRTEDWRFDHTLHFQYKGGTRKDQRHLPIRDVMSSVGACFFMSRDRFFALGGLDEAHGSWGQFGVEIACKSWLSGGRHVVNTHTWFAHLFRTQGADFGFPYPMSGAAQEKARIHSRGLWMGNRWPGQVRPLAWIIDHFAPVLDWHDAKGREALAAVQEAARSFRVVVPLTDSTGPHPLRAGHKPGGGQQVAPHAVGLTSVDSAPGV